MSSWYADNSLSIGKTPLVRLNRVIGVDDITVLAKIEGRNPAYSVKCRIGAAMVADALERGILTPGRELVEPTSGRVLFEGRNVTAANDAELRRIRRRIGMVFQHFNLVHRSTVLTNVLAGRLGYVSPFWSLVNRFPKEDVEKAQQQLARVGLQGRAHNRADALSGGQQQRVGIARALMQDPTLILADEPVASLDPVLAHSIMEHLEQINRDDGVTVLCSLHFLDLVHQYADRVVALNEGKLMFDGLPTEIDDAMFKDIYGQEAKRVG